MFYTLAKWALWLVAAAAIGFVIGWLLRGLRRAAAAVPDDDPDELERLRARVTQLEPAARDRDRLRIELDDCRETAAELRAEVAAALAMSPAALAMPPAAAAPQGIAAAASPATVTPALPAAAAEEARLQSLVSEHESTIGELRVRLWNQDAKISELQSELDAHKRAGAPADPDVTVAETVLGRPIRLNDLTEVEGIGPMIADLCHRKGVRTWWQLANTEVPALRAMLQEAGPRFQVHDPVSWPQQAVLLANGRWHEFRMLTEQLKGGRSAE